MTMCKIISSDTIIGNFVIESLEKDDFRIEFEKLFNFDEQLSERLVEHNYFTNFDLVNVVDFKETYPFLIDYLDNECFHIVKDIENKDELCSMLVRYFRLGMPKVVINEMKMISKVILG